MEAVPHMRKLVLAGAVGILAALGTTAPAYGGGCSNSSSNPPSSVAQYTEQNVTACGDKPTSGSTTTRKIPKQLEQKIDSQAGADAPTIKAVVSQSNYGAPSTPIKAHKAKKHTKKTKNGKASNPGTKRIVSDSETRSNPLAASVGVITDGSDARLIALIALMVAVAGIVVVSALRRRRVTR